MHIVDGKSIFTTAELMEVVGITQGRVTQLRDAGVFIRVGKNRKPETYDAIASLKNLVKFRIQAKMARFQPTTDGARLLKAKADREESAAEASKWHAAGAEMDYKASAETLVNAQEVFSDLTARDKVLQRQMRAISSTLKTELGGMDPPQIQTRILEEIDAVLNAFSNRDNAEHFYEQKELTDDQ